MGFNSAFKWLILFVKIEWLHFLHNKLCDCGAIFLSEKIVALPLEKAQLFYARRCVMIFREISAVYLGRVQDGGDSGGRDRERSKPDSQHDGSEQ
jgi:hypothetical protein